jgi:glycosyltransferase involved in cell wall biosynthesis
VKILFIVSYIPIKKSLGVQGPKNLTKQSLLYLSKTHEVDLITLSDDNVNYSDIVGREFLNLNSYRQLFIKKKYAIFFRRLNSLVNLTPLTLGNYNSSTLQEILRGESSNYDIVHFDYFLLAENFKSVPENIPTVLYSHDAYSLYYYYASKYSRSFKNYLYNKIKEFIFINMERKYYKCVDKVLTVSEIDSKVLRDHGVSNVSTLPIPIRNKYKLNDLHVKEGNCFIVLACPYISKNDQYITDHFLEKYLPLLLKLDIKKVILFGKNLEKSQIAKSLISLEKVEYIGYADDYFEFLNRDIVYVYLRQVGSGLHTKLQDAMSLGLPVVGFSNLLNSLGKNTRRFCVGVETIEELYNAITLLSTDKLERKRLGKCAYEYTCTEYDPTILGRQLDEHYKILLENKKIV